MPLNPIEEAKFAALEKNCQDLGVPAPPSIHITFEVKDKDGNLIFRDKQRGHSWTRNYYNALLLNFGAGAPSGSTFGAGLLTTKQITAQITSAVAYFSFLQGDHAYIKAASGIVNRGIVFGIGNTAFSAEQFNLVTPIANGSTAGTFAYDAQKAASTIYTSGTKTWTTRLERVANNNSGGEIAVKEIGLFCYAGGTWPTMLERTVLSPTVTVPNAAQLTAKYDISMSLAAID